MAPAGFDTKYSREYVTDHLACGVGEVEQAAVVLRCASRAVVESSADVLGNYRAEVLVIAVVAAVVGVASAPQRLFVKLNLVLVDTSEEACAELSVSDGQAILHPDVAHASQCGGFVVPQRELILGREALDAHHLVVGV